jgi:hypothetical protein
MRNKLSIFVLCGVILALTVSIALGAGTPSRMNYQGRLTNPTGTPLTGAYSIVFTIYDDTVASSPGNIMWRETHPSVSVAEGLFNVILGAGTPAVPLTDSVFSSPNRWLGIRVGADPEISPRTRLTSVPYSFRVGTVDSASGGTISGDLMVTGKVGIGTGNPTEKLDVEGSIHASGAIISGSSAIALAPAGSPAGFPDRIAADGGAIYFGYEDPVGSGTFANCIGMARIGNTLYGLPTVIRSHVNLGVLSTTGTSGQNFAFCTVGGGYFHTAAGIYATIGGGDSNSATKEWSTVAGGAVNEATAAAATVGGGYHNIASGDSSTVVGGAHNNASYLCATVGGGSGNAASSRASTISGGLGNTAGHLYTTVGGGWANSATNALATVAGGHGNTASGIAACVSGGESNTAGGSHSAVLGGSGNGVDAHFSLAAGTSVNIASSAEHTFAFGWDFSTAASHAVVFHDTHTPIKLGVGTTAPAKTLDVGGEARIQTLPVDNSLSDVVVANPSGDLRRNTSIGGGQIPIGAVTAWLKSFPPGAPPLSSNFVECNGQILSDPGSIYNGQVIPNLNGQNRFLRGSTTGGATGGSSTHNHSISAPTEPIVNNSYDLNRTYANSASTSTNNNLPPYYEVVWIMRIK